MKYRITYGESIKKTDDRNTPDFFASSLLSEIASRTTYIERNQDYLTGANLLDHFSTPETNQVEGLPILKAMAQTNWAKLIVSATTDRLGILGFRSAAASDENGDEVIAQLFDRDEMGIQAQEAMALACGYRQSYLYVDPRTKRQKVFPPTNAAVMRDPYGEPIAAVVMYRDRALQRDVLNLFIRGEIDPATGEAAGGVYMAVAVKEITSVTPTLSIEEARARAAKKDHECITAYDTEIPYNRLVSQGWTWWKEYDPIEVSRIPVTVLKNKDARAEFEEHISLIDRINHMVAHRLLIATMQAFRQRVFIGNFKEFDREGRPIDYDNVFKNGIGINWMLPKESNFQESAQTSFQEFLQAAKQDVQDLASLTYTPMSYFSDSLNQSSAGADAARENSTAKVEDRRKRFAPAWKRHVSLLLELNGEKERADINKLEPIWGPLQTYTLTEKTAAFATLVTNGIAISTALREGLHFTPEQITRAQVEIRDEALWNQVIGQSNQGTPLTRAKQANSMTQQDDNALKQQNQSADVIAQKRGEADDSAN